MTAARADFVRALAGLPTGEAEALLEALGEAELRRMFVDWRAWAHGGQAAPDGDWRVWVMLAGRGFGKTRAGAQWVEAFARANPGAAIALVAANVDEARRVMIEGRSGLLALPRVGPPPKWQPSLRRLRFASGAEANIYSGADPEGLRGPEHHLAWCDELAKWRRPQETWDNLQLGLRCGTRPRTLVTTTPRGVAALGAILGEEGVVRTGGGTADNPFLARAAVAALQRMHGGTRLGRQELEGEWIEAVDGALWPPELIAASRAEAPVARERLVQVAVGVDPPAGEDGAACGIVVCGLDIEGNGYVLADHSVGGLSPEGWARKVAAAAEAHGATRVVAEVNNGGAMVEAVLRGAGLRIKVRSVHASEGKAARAAPVAALFESKRATFAGAFPALEAELARLTWRGTYEGRGSPDRADAMVWAMSDLMLAKPRAEPRIRSL
ncbi:MAG TPA: terminase family protein [Allosphingosinicella sp.]|jgi:phage terminase large subunit-like protein